jgi:DnaJ family protein C protein 3
MLPKDGTLNKAAAVRPLSDLLLTSVTCRARDTTFSRMRHAKHLILILVITLASAAVLASGQQVPLEEQNGGASSASEFLKQGTKAMASGRFADAISHFDDAILADPDNYLSYYRRATAALSLGRSGSAMSDFDKINQMNPKFPQAHLQKAKLLAKDGRLDRAKESVDQYVKLKKDDEEGKELKKTIEGATSNLKSLKKTKEGIDKILHSGKNITTDKTLPTKLEDCLKLASLVLEISPSSLEARRDRADCALAKGEHEDAIADWT